MKPIVDDIRYFIDENFLFGQGGDQFANSDSFLERGIIDSAGVLELVSYLEGKYPIRIADEELIPDNLDSVDNLVVFLEKKLADAGNEV